MPDTLPNLADLVYLAVCLIAVWGFVKVIMEIIEAITKRHDREQAWDGYDKRLSSIEDQIKEVRGEQGIMMETLQAVLDGMLQLKCNGHVTEQKKKIDVYLNNQAHKIGGD